MANLANSTRVALVIGNSSYRHLQPLRNASRDAREVCEALNRLNFKAVCVYDLGTRRAFREVVNAFFSQVNGKHTVVFYFAGHGFQVESENYLMPTEIEPRTVVDIEEDGISLTYLKGQIALSRSGPNLLILDACSDGPADATSKPIPRGLARADPPDDSLLVFASGPNQGAIDDAGENGLFAKHLLAHMEKPGLSVEQLMAVVAEAVDKEAHQLNASQRPFRNSNLTQRFCLAACDDPDTNREQLARQLERIQAELEERSMRDSKREAEVQAMKAADSQREARIRELQADIAARDRDVADLQRRSEELQRRSTGIEYRARQVQALRSEMDDLEQKRRSGLADLAKQSAMRERELADLHDAESKLEVLRQEIRGYKSSIRDLQRKVETLSVGRSEAPRGPRVIVPNF